MSVYYRHARKAYEAESALILSGGTSNDTVWADNLLGHMMENVAPRIWTTIGFDDQVADILDKTYESFGKKDSALARSSDKELEDIQANRLSLRKIVISFAKAALPLFHRMEQSLNPSSPRSPMVFRTIEAADEMKNLHKQFIIYSRPPYPKFWIDMPPMKGSNDRYSVLVEENPEKFLPKAPFLDVAGNLQDVWTHFKSFDIPTIEPRYRGLFFRNGNPVKTYFYFVPHERYLDVFYALGEDPKTPVVPHVEVEIIARKLRVALILLNTKNSPFTSLEDAEYAAIQAGTQEEIEAFENKLAIRNSREKLALKRKIIKFDISRIMKKFPNATAKEIHHFLQRHFVRGHFKLRAQGLFWWSPYFRGSQTDNQSDEAILGRQSKITALPPSKLPPLRQAATKIL